MSSTAWIVLQIVSIIIGIIIWVCVINSFHNHTKRIKTIERFLDYQWSKLSKEEKNEIFKRSQMIRQKESEGITWNLGDENHIFDPKIEEKESGNNN